MNDGVTRLGFGDDDRHGAAWEPSRRTLDPADAARWLAAVRKDDGKAVRHVVSWLERHRTAGARSALEVRFPANGSLPLARVLDGTASLTALRDARRITKSGLETATTADQHAPVLLAHLLLTASAIRFHGTVLGGRTVTELQPLLLDLAATIDEPFRSVLADAAVTPDPAEGSAAAASG